MKKISAFFANYKRLSLTYFLVYGVSIFFILYSDMFVKTMKGLLKEEVPKGFVRVADYGTLEYALNGRVGKNIRIIPVSSINLRRGSSWLHTGQKVTCFVDSYGRLIFFCMDTRAVIIQEKDFM